MSYLSIDIGTTGGKVLLFSDDMVLLQTYQADYPTYQNGKPDQAEHDPEDWWKLAKDGVRHVMHAIGAEPVRAIGLSCMTPVMLALDASGHPLSRAWLWCDRRGGGMLPYIHDRIPAKRFVEICGSSLKEISFLAKLMYFKEKMPELYDETFAFLQANGYMIYKMCGRMVLDESHLSLLHLFEKKDCSFSTEILEALDIDRAKFPELCAMKQIVGTLSAAAAKELGLAAGIPIVAGGHDSALSAYVYALDTPGRACVDIGNAANLVMASASAVRCPAADIYIYPDGHKWLFQIYTATCGAAFRWFRNLFGQEEMRIAQAENVSEYDLLCHEARKTTVGANGLLFLPYLQGSQQCASVSGSWTNIRLSHTRSDFIRSLLEGCAMSVRYNKEEMEKDSGIRIEYLTACGGGSKNRFWLQIFADVLNLTIHVSRITEAACTGAAMLAYAAVNGNNRENSKQAEDVIVPNAEDVSRYNEIYERFSAVFNREISDCTANI